MMLTVITVFIPFKLICVPSEEEVSECPHKPSFKQEEDDPENTVFFHFDLEVCQRGTVIGQL